MLRHRRLIGRRIWRRGEFSPGLEERMSVAESNDNEKDEQMKWDECNGNWLARLTLTFRPLPVNFTFYAKFLCLLWTFWSFSFLNNGQVLDTLTNRPVLQVVNKRWVCSVDDGRVIKRSDAARGWPGDGVFFSSVHGNGAFQCILFILFCKDNWLDVESLNIEVRG